MPDKHYRIGRSADDSDIVIEDPQRTVSSLHAELYQDELGRWYLIDRSRNGTFVYRNSHWTALKHDTIAPGESLSFGRQIVAMEWLIQQVQHLSGQTGQPPDNKHREKTEPADIKPEKKQGRKPSVVADTPARPVTQGYIRDPETGKIRPRRSDE